MPLAHAIGGACLVVLGATVNVSPDQPFGWLGPVLLALLGAYSLWRAGTAKAWKETAEARMGRIDTLTDELTASRGELAVARLDLAEARSELKIPERIEGILHLMGEQAVRQDAAAEVRLERALLELRGQAEEHERCAERRCDRIIDAVRGGAAA